MVGAATYWRRLAIFQKRAFRVGRADFRAALYAFAESGMAKSGVRSLPQSALVLGLGSACGGTTRRGTRHRGTPLEMRHDTASPTLLSVYFCFSFSKRVVIN